MNCLAIECSSSRRSVAVLTRAGLLVEEAGIASRGVPMFEMIRRVLDAAGLERGAVERFAVGLGPGSYTGIRAALAVAQGWRLATGARLVGCRSTLLVGLGCRRLGRVGRVVIATDAQRGEFYWETFEIGLEAIRPIGPLRLGSREALMREVSPGMALVRTHDGILGPEAETVFPDAGDLARWAAGASGSELKVPMEPVYLRPTAFVKAPASGRLSSA